MQLYYPEPATGKKSPVAGICVALFFDTLYWTSYYHHYNFKLIMEPTGKKSIDRRHFIRASAGLAGGLAFLPQLSFANHFTPPDNINIIGPLEGYSPQLGTFISMLNWIRESVLRAVKDLKPGELDFLMDPKANTIGAMLSHLAATETVYQDLTFYNLKDFSEANKKRWSVAMELGEEGRKQIKGNNLDYYLSALKEVREKSLSEFKKRDDKWLAIVDPQFFGNQPTNNYCKWFHVCEHEANHRGQMTLVRKRIPGNSGND
ncbi:MAG: DinB family protein [Chitinophagaceae bacterium]